METACMQARAVQGSGVSILEMHVRTSSAQVSYIVLCKLVTTLCLCAVASWSRSLQECEFKRGIWYRSGCIRGRRAWNRFKKSSVCGVSVSNRLEPCSIPILRSPAGSPRVRRVSPISPHLPSLHHPNHLLWEGYIPCGFVAPHGRRTDA